MSARELMDKGLIGRMWSRVLVCWRVGHDWQADPVPNMGMSFGGDGQNFTSSSAIYTPSSTCRRCGARKW